MAKTQTWDFKKWFRRLDSDSQDAFAEACGTTVSTIICKLIHGYRIPNTDALERMADALGAFGVTISPDELRSWFERANNDAERRLAVSRQYKATEHEEQSSLIGWVALQKAQNPDLELLYAIPNGGERHPAVAARMKAEGVRAGVPDLHLPVARGPFHGLYIEMKAMKGRASAEQVEWIEKLSRQGYRAVVCRGWDAARKELTEYLGLGRFSATDQPFPTT